MWADTACLAQLREDQRSVGARKPARGSGAARAAVRHHKRIGNRGSISVGDIGRVLRKKVVPDDEPRAVELRLTLRPGEEPDVQMRATIADPVDVRSRDVRLRL